MKFSTRIRITFITIIILPLLLTIFAFILIGMFLSNSGPRVDIDGMGETVFPENIQQVVKQTDAVYFRLLEQAGEDVTAFEDIEYLKKMDEEIARKSTYIIVRKDNDIYYAKNNTFAKKVFENLPQYGDAPLSDKTGYYIDNVERYVKQIDFKFTDGSEGSIFILSKAQALISKRLLVDMFIAIVLILIFTSICLTQWIRKGVFTPLSELNIAMQKIKDGDFEYRLETQSEGEIGALYSNYEDMRLRLKESAEEKVEQERVNKELVSNISHDLKTPITAIKGYVEGIMDGVADTPEKMDKYIKTIYNKANDMDKLINELTTYSGIDNNRIPYNFHRINVADYFGDCVEEVGLDLESKNIKLNYLNLVSPDTVVIADPEQMKKVINNIISNSVKYMDKSKGQIDIRILDEVDSIRVELEDNGKGIAQKDLQKIFDRFYRTDASRNSAQGGSGIGLSIVRKIIEDHGGYIWATSKEGEGTCIHFVIRKYEELQPTEV